MGFFHSISHAWHKITHGISHAAKELFHHPLYALGGLSLIPGVGTALGLGSSTLLGAGESAVSSGLSSLGLGSVGTALGLGSSTSLLGMGSMADTALGASSVASSGTLGLTGIGSLSKILNAGYDVYSLTHKNTIPSAPSIDYSKMPKLDVNVQKPNTTSAPPLNRNIPWQGTKNQGLPSPALKNTSISSQYKTQIPYNPPDVNNNYMSLLNANQTSQKNNKIPTNKNVNVGAGYGFNLGYGNSYTDITRPTNNISATQYAPPGFEAIVTTHYSPDAETRTTTLLTGFKNKSTGKIYKLSPQDAIPISFDTTNKGHIEQKYGNVDSKNFIKQIWAKAGLGQYAQDNVVDSIPFMQRTGLATLDKMGILNKPHTYKTNAEIANIISSNAPQYNSSGLNSNLSGLLNTMLTAYKQENTTSTTKPQNTNNVIQQATIPSKTTTDTINTNKVSQMGTNLAGNINNIIPSIFNNKTTKKKYFSFGDFNLSGLSLLNPLSKMV